ncbi:MAG TPA: peptidoglycan-binding protein [Candidatus Dormibacteraeota bacterium]|nr:peptidoglycan-binding protein [Candidatus Dormibacteraeota bacterium]
MSGARTKVIAGVAVVAAAAAVLGAVAVERRPASAAPSLDAVVTPAVVTRQTLLDQFQVNGTIGYSGAYQVVNQYLPPPSAASLAQARHALDAARQSLADTQAQTDLANRQDAAAVTADQAQLAADQQKLADAQARGDAAAVQQATQAVGTDQSKLAQDQAKQQADQVANQARLHTAQQQVTSAQDQYDQKTQPGGGGSGSASGGGGGAGVYTALPGAGQTVGRGQPVYAVNGRPIPLLYGTVPLARQLLSGVSGDDVKELEDNLIALGYGAELTADGSFTSADAAAVERWQAALGVAQSGVVNPGEAVVLPGALRVSQVKALTGASAQTGQEIIDGTSPDHVVNVNLDARQQTLVQVGAGVDVALPNGSRVKGTITDVGTVATTSGQGPQQQTTVPVTITLADNATAGRLDGAAVTVSVTRASRQNVLAVPITALLALPGGGYAVETADGRHRRIPVQTGLFSNGMVEVSGTGLTEGLRVVSPSV